MDISGEIYREGIELLAAGVLKAEYMDLIDARLAFASFTHWNTSYNCHMYRERLLRNKGRYGYKEDGKENARIDIKKSERWFKSEDCEVYCINISGQWFIDIALRRAKEFENDLIPYWMARPIFDNSESTGGNSALKRREFEKWQKKRDKWRAEKGLKKVE